MLREAVDHGLEKWIDLEIDKDPDLEVLHNDPRFEQLVAYAKSVAGAPAAKKSLYQHQPVSSDRVEVM